MTYRSHYRYVNLQLVARLGHHGVRLRFTLFGIPVTIRPSFLLIAALLGFSTRQIAFVVAWVGVLFVSILVHELGHALTARRFGSDVAIELNGIGGLTSWTIPDDGISPGRRALIAAAGSATGLAFGALIWLGLQPFGPFLGLTGFVLTNLVRVNVFWGLLNWLPIRVLDGGHLFSALLEKIAPKNGQSIANVVFFVTAAAGLVVAIWFRLIFVGFIAAWLLWGEIARTAGTAGPVGLPQMDFDAPGKAPVTETESGSSENRPEGPPEPTDH